MLSHILKSTNFKITIAKGLKFQRLLLLCAILYLSTFTINIAECGNVGEALPVAELESLIECLTFEDQAELRQRYFDIAVKHRKGLEALHDEPPTSSVKWQAVVIFTIGTGVLFLISRYGDLFLDLIRESSSTVAREAINIGRAIEN